MVILHMETGEGTSPLAVNPQQVVMVSPIGAGDRMCRLYLMGAQGPWRTVNLAEPFRQVCDKLGMWLDVKVRP